MVLVVAKTGKIGSDEKNCLFNPWVVKETAYIDCGRLLQFVATTGNFSSFCFPTSAGIHLKSWYCRHMFAV